ncbi:PAS domain S-box protein [Methanosarcina sp.]|uniref:PAS domain S-box protein n=1 Tax=Methanosarcina sp. TaxID=2213 RepID=UPI003C752941
MKGQLRKSGIDIIGDVPWGTHFCQFYQTKEDLIEILIPYFKAGLENNEFCMWVTSKPLEVEEAKEALKKAVPDLDIYLERGQIEILPDTSYYAKGNSFDLEKSLNLGAEKFNHALISGYDGLRSSGNLSWLKKTDLRSFIDYEEKVDSTIGSYRIIALCTYSLETLSATEIIDFAINHQFALIKREGKWEQIESPRRRKAEETAIQAAKNWEYTFDAVPDLIAILDTEYRIVRANRAMAAKLEVTPEECAGLTCYRAVHGTEKPPSFCPQRQLLKDGLEHTAEVCEDCLGGYFLVSVSPLYDSKGKLIGSIHVARDINERKQAEKALQESEEKYRYIVETANEGIWILDAEARTTYVNEKMAETLGYGQEEMIGRSLLDFADEEGEAIFKPNLEKRRQGINEVYESKLICKDGSPLWVLVSVKALLNKDGKFTGSLGMLTDITRRNQEEHRIHRYNRVLEGINRIFGSIVKAETEEELGVACLSVAVDVTCSQIGFVGEVNTDGLMHDVAISNSGWDECLMYDKTGHRRLPGDHILHGLYGRVINSGKGFFTNDPRSHPDSIGLPEGHPPLRSFLGVPLILDEKTIGILGVANRKGGYTSEQQEDLEAIAPAVTQALQRKKTEQERAQAEEALIRSEKRFRTLAENSPDIITRFDRQKRHIYTNPAAAEPYGRSPEEIIGKTHGELGMDPENVKFWEEHHKKVFATGKPETMEFQYTSPKGKEYYFNTQVVPEFVDSKVASVLAISHDITDIKKAESRLKDTLDNLEKLVKERTVELENAYELLKESGKGLAEAQKMAHLGNWEWNIVTNKVYWSDEIYRILRFKPQEFEVTYKSLLNYVHPDERDYVENAVKRTLNGEPYDLELRMISADGEERIVHTQGDVTFDEKNTPIAMRGTAQDITERKRTEKALELSEERYRIIAEQTGQLVYDYNVEEDIAEWAGNIKEITGYTSEKFRNMSVEFLLSCIHPEDRKMFLESYERFLTHGGAYRSEYRFRKEDGEYIYLEDNGVCLKDEEGKVKRILGAIKDITERKKAENALANIESARKREIHHRIKNNLQVISSLLDLQAEKFKNRKHVEDSDILDAFRESQDRVLSIALIHEELHEGKGTDKLNFCPYLEKLVENLFKTYRVGNIDISLNMDLEENIFFDMDVAVPLGLIVNEIVSNSLKYAFPGRDKGTIRIKLCREENGESASKIPGRKEDYKRKPANFVLAVSDNGIGLPDNFDLQDSDTLGLQLIFILVDQLEGKLELNTDSGTEFIIRFVVSDKE